MHVAGTDLYPTREGRWVVRDTHAALARAVIVHLFTAESSFFRATEFHVIPDSATLIGDYLSLSEALDAVRAYVGTQSRPRP